MNPFHWSDVENSFWGPSGTAVHCDRSGLIPLPSDINFCSFAFSFNICLVEVLGGPTSKLLSDAEPQYSIVSISEAEVDSHSIKA